MRFAFKTAPQDTTWEAMLAVWKAADQIDFYESGWLFDHFYPIFGDSTGPCLEGWVTLAALAQATTRLRVGVLVTGMIYRHPAVLANMAASLDVISGGRLELGTGAGWNQEECDAYGIELPPLKERFDQFDEGMEVLVQLLTQTTSDFSGEHFQLTGARCEPKPIQQPHPPIVIGGGGEKRTLRSVARFAQHWNYPGGPAEDFAHKVEVLHAHCADLGRDPAGIITSTHLRLDPSGDLASLIAQAEAYAAVGLDLGIVALPPAQHRPEVLEPIADALLHLA